MSIFTPRRIYGIRQQRFELQTRVRNLVDKYYGKIFSGAERVIEPQDYDCEIPLHNRISEEFGVLTEVGL